MHPEIVILFPKIIPDISKIKEILSTHEIARLNGVERHSLTVDNA
jgi:hypothetical protein